MLKTDLVNLYNRNFFETSLYIYIFQDEKCRLMRNLSLSMVLSNIHCFVAGTNQAINGCFYWLSSLDFRRVERAGHLEGFEFEGGDLGRGMKMEILTTSITRLAANLGASRKRNKFLIFHRIYYTWLNYIWSLCYIYIYVWRLLMM